MAENNEGQSVCGVEEHMGNKLDGTVEILRAAKGATLRMTGL